MQAWLGAFLVLTATQLFADAEPTARLSADLNNGQAVTFDDFFLFFDQFGQTLAPLLQPLTDRTVPLGTSLRLNSDQVQGQPLFC